MDSNTKSKDGVTVEGTGTTGAAFVVISGRIGIEEANELQRRFDEILKAGRPWIILSLRDVEFMCSAAMGTLLSGVGEARRAGGEIIFTEISPKAKTIFEFLDVWDYITTAPDREAAQNLIAAGRRNGPRAMGRRAEVPVTPAELRAQLAEGVRLSKEGNLKDALACFNVVLKADKDNLVALTWKANALERLGQFGEARRLYLQVCEAERVTPQLQSYARERVGAINKRLQLAGPESDIAEQLHTATKRLVQPAKITEFLSAGKTTAGVQQPFLESYRPWQGGDLFDGAAALALTGGGYFLWFGNRGIAVDPGAGFVSQYAKGERRLADIDIIFVTNAAWEHSADLELLLELVRRNNALRDGVDKKVDLYLSTGVYRKNISWLGEIKDVIGRMTVVNAGRTYQLGNAEVAVKPAAVTDDGADETAVGLLFDDGASRFAYVADAPGGMLDTLASHYRDARGRVMLVPLGAIYAGQDPAARWGKGHLGVEGAVQLLAEVRPAIALLAQLGNVADPAALTATVVRAAKVRCLPLDAGLRVNLATGHIAVGGDNIAPADINVSLDADRRIKYRAATR